MTLEAFFTELQKTLIETRDHLIQTNAVVLRLQERVAVLEREICDLQSPAERSAPFDFAALQTLRKSGGY